MKFLIGLIFTAGLFHFIATASAIPLTLRYQGHVRVQGVPFEGAGQFKFALLDSDANTLWSNDGTSVGGSEPTAFVPVTVTRGIYEVGIGDPSIANMAILPKGVFDHDHVFLRAGSTTRSMVSKP